MIDHMYKLFLDEMAFLNNESYFAHQKMKNIQGSGGLVETAIRKLLQEVLGNRFRVTHGYIYSSMNSQPSKQLDVIITDTLVSHTLKKFEYLNGLEIVPIEAVVGIFEVKRTLTRNIVIEAAEHLKEVIKFVPIVKDNPARYLAGGIKLLEPLRGGNFSNPMVGIIGLNHDETLNDLPSLEDYSFLDIIYSVDGYFKGCENPDKPGSFKTIACRSEQSFKYRTLQFDINKPQKLSKEQILKIAIGYLLCFLNETSGRTLTMDDYFTINLADI